LAGHPPLALAAASWAGRCGGRMQTDVIAPAAPPGPPQTLSQRT